MFQLLLDWTHSVWDDRTRGSLERQSWLCALLVDFKSRCPGSVNGWSALTIFLYSPTQTFASAGHIWTFSATISALHTVASFL